MPYEQKTAVHSAGGSKTRPVVDAVTSRLRRFCTKQLKPPTVTPRILRLPDGKMGISAPLPQTAMDTARGRRLGDGCIYSLSSIPGISDSSSEVTRVYSGNVCYRSESETGDWASVERDVFNSRVSPDTLICKAPALSTANGILGPQPSMGKETDIEEPSIDEEADSSVDMLEFEDNVHSHAGPPPVTHRYGKLFTPTELGHIWSLQHATGGVKTSNGHQIRCRNEGGNQSNVPSLPCRSRVIQLGQ